MYSYGPSGAICLVARVTWAAGEFYLCFHITLMFCLCSSQHVLALSLQGIQCFS